MGKTADPGLIEPPRKCRCGQPSVITQIEVIHNETNQRRIGSFSEFGEVKGRGRTQKRVLRSTYRFSRWLPACAECYSGASTQEAMF